MNVTWQTQFRHPSTNNSAIIRRISGHDLLAMYKTGYIIKIFERLRASLKRVSMSKRKAIKNKMDLFKEYKFPKPFPPDMMLKLPRKPDHAYVILSQQGTGKSH